MKAAQDKGVQKKIGTTKLLDDGIYHLKKLNQK